MKKDELIAKHKASIRKILDKHCVPMNKYFCEFVIKDKRSLINELASLEKEIEQKPDKTAEELLYDMGFGFDPKTDASIINMMKLYVKQMQKIDTYNLRELLNDLNYNIEVNLMHGIDNIHVTYLKNLWNKLSDEITKIEEHGK